MKLKDFLLKALWQDPNYEIHQVSCPEISIEEVPQDLYDKLVTEAHAAGAKFEGEKVSLDGAEFSWTYDGESQTLHVTCLKKPFFISCDSVEQRIRELVMKAKDVVG